MKYKMCEQMHVLQICGQIELLWDLINKNEGSVPIQDPPSDQVLLNAPYSESVPPQTQKARY